MSVVQDGLANVVVMKTFRGWHCPHCSYISPSQKGNLKVHILNRCDTTTQSSVSVHFHMTLCLGTPTLVNHSAACSVVNICPAEAVSRCTYHRSIARNRRWEIRGNCEWRSVD